MRVTEVKVASAKEFLPLLRRQLKGVGNTRRPAFLLFSIFVSVLLIVFSSGCGTPSRSDGSQSQTASDPGEIPEITDETIRERLNQSRVRDIPEENGAGEPISWRFFEEEPKEVTV
ncbi:MAG: hypothetical protein ABI539_03890, partial [Acidobacteriota bacterium]